MDTMFEKTTGKLGLQFGLIKFYGATTLILGTNIVNIDILNQIMHINIEKERERDQI